MIWLIWLIVMGFVWRAYRGDRQNPATKAQRKHDWFVTCMIVTACFSFADRGLSRLYYQRKQERELKECQQMERDSQLMEPEGGSSLSEMYQRSLCRARLEDQP